MIVIKLWLKFWATGKYIHPLHSQLLEVLTVACYGLSLRMRQIRFSLRFLRYKICYGTEMAFSLEKSHCSST